MLAFATSLSALVLAALSLSPSFAHVLEAPPRLAVWSPALWREATVFNGQFEFFARIGGPVDVGAIVAAWLLSYVLRRERLAFCFGLAGATLLTAGLTAWFGIVAPANAILASWQPGPIPSDFSQVRIRWETGHMIVASLKFLGFVSICLAVLAPRFPGSRAASG
jgi:hypothetical protein